MHALGLVPVLFLIMIEYKIHKDKPRTEQMDSVKSDCKKRLVFALEFGDN